MTMPDTDFYCAALARANGEPLFATALEARTWLLLEFAGEWRRKATSDNDLPGHITDWLAEQMEALDTPRLQLIKQPPAFLGEYIDFFVAFAAEDEPRLYHFRMADYDELLTLNLGAVRRGDAMYADQLVVKPLVLVCTNGKRDRCCAQRGVGVYTALQELIGERVWQTTHLGGHRFAANGVILPAGIMMGRLDDADLSAFVGDLAQGVVAADLYRGRSAWTAAGQAAEYLLRQAVGTIPMSGMQLVEVVELAADRWRVELRDADGVQHVVEIEQVTVAGGVYASCGSFEPKATQAFRLVT